MQVLQWLRTRSMRVMCFALFLCVIPASSRAGVFISVGIAPPPLPVVAVDDQPLCPEPGWIWTPGYWAYGDDGYYWVPGTWVPAPEPGLLWTPGYWGWNAGLYAWHPGYWGPHVGYYGGVNYGFGYFGIGFVGGMWRGHDFVYNTAVWRVNRTVIRNVYEDRTVIENHEVVRDRHIAYSGGPGGIRHDPDRDERGAMNEHHWGASQMQSQHEFAARGDHSSYFNNNHGRPDHVVVARPMEGNPHGANPQFIQRGNQNIHQAPNGGQFNNGQQHGQQPGEWNRNNTGGNNGMGQRGNNPQQPENQPQPQQHQWQQPQQQHQQQPQNQPQPQQHQWQQPEPHNNPQPPPQPQQHQWHQPQPQQHQQQPQPHNNPQPQPQPQQHNNSQPHEDHGGGGHDHGH